MGVESAIFEIIHESIRHDESALTVSALCEIAGVSRSGYYRWEAAAGQRAKQEEQDQADFSLILEAYKYRGYKKGVRSIHMRLLHMGIIMNPKKIRRLMHKYNLFCPIRKANPYRRMAAALRTNNVAENLLNREFESHGPRAVLLTDITYIRFQDSFLYLSTILDAYTKEALAHVLSESLEVDFVLETVQIMQRDYGVSLQEETIIHSDQGCHYTSVKFITLVQDLGLRQSMSRRGNCWDNAPQESFYGHMKDELADKMTGWTCFADVKRDIDDWFDYYNHDRYQWQLAKLSPSQYYWYVTTGEYPLPVNILILISVKNSLYPLAKSDALNSFHGEVVDRLAESVNNLFKCLKDFVAKALGAQLAPDLFNGVHFGCIGWDVQQRDIRRDLQRFRLVPGGPITDQE